MKTMSIQHQNKFFSQLLGLCVMAALLLSLMMPGLAGAAPAGAPYIIVFKDTVEPASAAQGVANAYGLQPGFVYEHALKGMSAFVPEGRLTALQHDPRVSYVVEDMLRSIDVQSMPTVIQRIFADTNRRSPSTGRTTTGWMWMWPLSIRVWTSSTPS